MPTLHLLNYTLYIQTRIASSCLRLSAPRAATVSPLSVSTSRWYSNGGQHLPVSVLTDEEKMMKETGIGFLYAMILFIEQEM